MRVAIAIWVGVVAVTLFASGYFDGCLAEDGAAEKPLAADFELVRLDGLPVSTSALRGKTVILDFWATWCAPCEVQMPILDELWARRGGDRLMILGLSMDSDPPDQVQAWLAERGIGYPIAIADQQLAVDFGVWSFPTLIVLDPEGRIVRTHQGVLSRPELDDVLDTIDRAFPAAG